MKTSTRDLLPIAAVTTAISLCALSYYYLQKTNRRNQGECYKKQEDSSHNSSRTDPCYVSVPLVKLGEAHPASLLPENHSCIYLDYNATTPLFPEVTNVIIPFVTTCFGNPSSSHVYATVCRHAIQTSREQVGRLIHAPNPQHTIYFTSCGSESDNRAIDIALHHYHKRRTPTPRIITCAIEHPGSKNFNHYHPPLSLYNHTITLLFVVNDGSIDLNLPTSHHLLTLFYILPELSAFNDLIRSHYPLISYHLVRVSYSHILISAVLLYLKHLRDQGTIELKILGVNSEGTLLLSLCYPFIVHFSSYPSFFFIPSPLSPVFIHS